MVRRRTVLAGVAHATTVGLCSGCLSSSGGSPGRDDVPEQDGQSGDEGGQSDTAEAPPPEPGDLTLEAVPRGADSPHSEENHAGEYVWIENDARSAVSLDGAELAYPDGTRYVLGDSFSPVLPAGAEAYVFSDDRRPVELLSQPPVYEVGADLGDRPVLGDGSRVELYAPGGNEVATDSS